jgi:hypothetical protein
MTSRKSRVERERLLTQLGGNEVPVAKQMETLFPIADHFITQNYRNEQPRLWNTECFIGDRYVLTMQVPVIVDYSLPALSRAGDYQFTLLEVTNIRILRDGRVQNSYGEQTTFDLKTWQTIYEHGALPAGNELGINIKSSPVKRFDAFIRSMRKDRLRVSLTSSE